MQFSNYSMQEISNMPNLFQFAAKTLGVEEVVGMKRLRFSARVFDCEYSNETVKVEKEIIDKLINGDVEDLEGVFSTKVLISDEVISPIHIGDFSKEYLLLVVGEDGSECVIVAIQSFENENHEKSQDDMINSRLYGITSNLGEKCMVHSIFSNAGKSDDIVKALEKIIYENLVKEEHKNKDKIFMVKQGHNGLTPMPIDVDWSDIEIKKEYYNECFKEASEKIEEFFTEESKGKLCLIHGGAGTGKTTYLRSLVSKYGRDGVKFFFLPNSMVDSITDPSAISFFEGIKGGVLIIEDAEKALENRESSSASNSVSNILNLSDGMLSDAFNIKIIATFNGDKENLDKALKRKSRMHYMYEFKPLEEDRAISLAKQLGKNAEKIVGETTLADIFCLGEDNGEKEDPNDKKTIGFV